MKADLFFIFLEYVVDSKAHFLCVLQEVFLVHIEAVSIQKYTTGQSMQHSLYENEDET